MDLLIELHVKDFKAFESYERKASEVMAEYGGLIIGGYELERNEDDSGIEFHVVSFPSESDFEAYKQDQVMASLANLREQAISKTIVKPILQSKLYV